jgi:carboxyl-terminal processing protease
VSGASNQLKGVVPDIILPNIYDLIDLGERKEKSALPWDEIKPANYTTFKSKMDIAALRKKSQERVGKNASFQLVKQGAERMKALEEDNSYPLDYISYKAKIEETSKLSKELEKLEDVNTGIKIENLKVDLEKINLDSTSKAKNEDWLKLLKKDIYLNETMHIMSDLIQQQSGRSKK